MPIQIPFHSQAAPGVVPNAGARAMPGGFGSLQQAARMPLNDQRATADMFSGGLQGLQSVGNLLGNVGQGLFGIAEKLRAVDDYNTETEMIGALDNARRSVSQYVAENIDPATGEYEAYAEEAMAPVRALLEKDMPASQRAQLQRMVVQGGAQIKGAAFQSQFQVVQDKGLRNAALQDRMAQDNGDRAGIRPIWERAHALGLVDQEGMEAKIYIGEQAASREEIARDTANDPFAVRDALEEGKYENIKGADRTVALKKAHADINFKQAVAADNILLHYANTKELPTDGELNSLVERELMSPADAKKFRVPEPMGLGAFAMFQHKLYSLDPNDPSGGALLMKNRILTEVLASGDDAALDTLTAVAKSHWDLMTGEKKDMVKDTFSVIDATYKGLTGMGTEDPPADAMKPESFKAREQVVDLKRKMSEFLRKTPNVTPAMVESELRRLTDGKIDVDLPQRLGSPLRPADSTGGQPTAPAPLGTQSFTPEAAFGVPASTRSASGSITADPRTRDVIGKSSVEGARQVSLDFNDTDGVGGKASYSTIVIPDDATNEERVTAMAYTAKVTEFFAKYGHTMTDKGPVTRSANGRGTKGRFHTEPFFVGDAAARKIIEEHPDEYAKILADTLGQIPGVTFIAPHDKKNPGASRGSFNERDFAAKVLIPALLKH